MSLCKYYILESRTPKIVADMLTWARWNEIDENRRIAFTQINDRCEVSTIFLGIDHDFSRQGPPRLFETMIFGGPLGGSQWRCAFYGEAEKQHAAAVAEAKAAADSADAKVAAIADAAGAKLK